MHTPLKIADIKAGDEFYADHAGELVLCRALGGCQTVGEGFLVKISTPLGESELFQMGEVVRTKLYRKTG